VSNTNNPLKIEQHIICLWPDHIALFHKRYSVYFWSFMLGKTMPRSRCAYTEPWSLCFRHYSFILSLLANKE